MYMYNMYCVYVHVGALKERTSSLFSDVMEDFYRFSVIKARFEQWKFSHPETYDKTYVSLYLPKLFTPYVRYHLLQWNPLEVRYILPFAYT